MKGILIGTMLILLLTSGKQKDDGCLKLDIVLLADLSESVGREHIFIKQALLSYISAFKLSEDGVKIGLITFSSFASNRCSLTADNNYISERINNIPYPDGSTNMSEGFSFAFEELENNGREGYSRIVILISDGLPDNDEATIMTTHLLKVMNIKIFTIMVDSDEVDENFMKQIASPGCYVSTDYRNLTKELKKLDICM
jgi:uncharacterized protein YegL